VTKCDHKWVTRVWEENFLSCVRRFLTTDWVNTKHIIGHIGDGDVSVTVTVWGRTCTAHRCRAEASRIQQLLSYTIAERQRQAVCGTASYRYVVVRMMCYQHMPRREWHIIVCRHFWQSGTVAVWTRLIETRGDYL